MIQQFKDKRNQSIKNLEVIAENINSLHQELKDVKSSFDGLVPFEGKIKGLHEQARVQINSIETELNTLELKKSKTKIHLLNASSKKIAERMESMESKINEIDFRVEKAKEKVAKLLAAEKNIKERIYSSSKLTDIYMAQLSIFIEKHEYTMERLKGELESIHFEKKEMEQKPLIISEQIDEQLKGLTERLRDVGERLNVFQSGVDYINNFPEIIQENEKKALEYLKKEELSEFHFNVQEFERIKKRSKSLDAFIKEENVFQVEMTIKDVTNNFSNLMRQLELLVQTKEENDVLINSISKELDSQKEIKEEEFLKLQQITKTVSEMFISEETAELLDGFSTSESLLMEIESLLNEAIFLQVAEEYFDAKEILADIKKKLKDALKLKKDALNIFVYFNKEKDESVRQVSKAKETLKDILAKAKNAAVEFPDVTQVQRDFKKFDLLLEATPIDLDRLYMLSSSIVADVNIIGEQGKRLILKRKQLDDAFAVQIAKYENLYNTIQRRGKASSLKHPKKIRESFEDCSGNTGVEILIQQVQIDAMELEKTCNAFSNSNTYSGGYSSHNHHSHNDNHSHHSYDYGSDGGGSVSTD